jgi:hypothetical protein
LPYMRLSICSSSDILLLVEEGSEQPTAIRKIC